MVVSDEERSSLGADGENFGGKWLIRNRVVLCTWRDLRTSVTTRVSGELDKPCTNGPHGAKERRMEARVVAVVPGT
ncbi:unnamed protein product [Brassica oleracea]|uniref:(rape) hypothetical protein n=1 Tax=Brassica napus TaxID=3708 RepID=A0A816QJN2_BRANA|nr:unnamed protein product [Brassica napus]